MKRLRMWLRELSLTQQLISIIFLFVIHFQGLSWWDALFAGALLTVLCSSLLIFLESRKFSYELEEAETPHELQDAERARSSE